MSPLVWTRIGVNNIEPLTPYGLFEEGCGKKVGKKNDDGIWVSCYPRGNFVWAPATSVADLVLRQLGEDVHKRPMRFHVLVCPKLIIPVWGRLLFNVADFLVYVPLGSKIWSSSIHEYFLIGFFSPLGPHGP